MNCATLAKICWMMIARCTRGEKLVVFSTVRETKMRVTIDSIDADCIVYTKDSYRDASLGTLIFPRLCERVIRKKKAGVWQAAFMSCQRQKNIQRRIFKQNLRCLVIYRKLTRWGCEGWKKDDERVACQRWGQNVDRDWRFTCSGTIGQFQRRTSMGGHIVCVYGRILPLIYLFWSRGVGWCRVWK